MRKVFISAGHSSKIGKNQLGKIIDNGACANGFIEGVEAAELRNIIYTELKKLGLTASVDKDDSILADTLRAFKNLTTKDSIVVDIHFNSSSAAATGTETLVPDNPTQFEKDLAEAVNSSIVKTLGLKSRGVKTEASSHHGRLVFFRLTGENILLEVCFISNKSDMEAYRKNRFVLGKNIAEVIFKFANNVGSAEKIHIVQKGDSLSKIAAMYKTTITKIKTDNGLQTDTIQIGQKLKL